MATQPTVNPLVGWEDSPTNAPDTSKVALNSNFTYPRVPQGTTPFAATKEVANETIYPEVSVPIKDFPPYNLYNKTESFVEPLLPVSQSTTSGSQVGVYDSSTPPEALSVHTGSLEPTEAPVVVMNANELPVVPVEEVEVLEIKQTPDWVVEVPQRAQPLENNGVENIRISFIDKKKPVPGVKEISIHPPGEGNAENIKISFIGNKTSTDGNVLSLAPKGEEHEKIRISFEKEKGKAVAPVEVPVLVHKTENAASIGTPIVVHENEGPVVVEGPASTGVPLVVHETENAASTGPPIVVHENEGPVVAEGPASNGVPLVVHETENAASTGKPIVVHETKSPVVAEGPVSTGVPLLVHETENAAAAGVPSVVQEAKNVAPSAAPLVIHGNESPLVVEGPVAVENAPQPSTIAHILATQAPPMPTGSGVVNPFEGGVVDHIIKNATNMVPTTPNQNLTVNFMNNAVTAGPVTQQPHVTLQQQRK